MNNIKKYVKKWFFLFAKILRKINVAKKAYPLLDHWVDITRDAYYSEENKSMVKVPRTHKKKQLFFDVTTLNNVDDKTGIQRVVRSILHEWSKQPPPGFDIYPVVAQYGQYYHVNASVLAGKIDYQPGDIFFSADLNYEAASACENLYQLMRKSGVKVFFVVHDLLCMSMPQYFFKFAEEKHKRWLKIVATSDGCICVSKTVADEVSAWISTNMPCDKQSCHVGWFHLGADLKSSMPTRGMPSDALELLGKIKSRVSFLMVGRLEPRKGHIQTLKAFELLWQKNSDINLVIVGKQGWRVDALIKTLRKHPQIQNHLFWFENASDEFLEKIYSACACLIAASEGEGFGLPLIEAASYGLPLIVRNISVFHEVTQEHAFFFDGKSPEALADAIVAWLALFENKQHPLSKEMTHLTWSQSAQQLASVMLHKPGVL